MSKLAGLKRSLNFYGRFTHSFTRVGYMVRKLGWGRDDYDLSGQIWLVTGATGGIGSATVLKALEHGATVIAAARSSKKLAGLREKAGQHSERMIDEIVDLSLQSDMHALIGRLAVRPENIDVLVNNVGILNREHSTTPEGFETTYAINLLNHHLLTKSLIERSKLNKGARVINITSGGMYNAPLNTVMINQQEANYNGVAAYASHKRAQMALADHYRAEYQGNGFHFYAMHPGWVDTDGVKTSLPMMRAILWPILRNALQGADTIVWIGATIPEEVEEQVWFDRKPRPAHYMAASRKPIATRAQLAAHLDKDLEGFKPQTTS